MSMNFGKANRSVAFNPTSAFPLDARSYFESFADAQMAASTAELAGSSNTVYYIGQKLLVVENGVSTWYTIQNDKSLKKDSTSGGVQFSTDDTLSLKDGVLSVNTANTAEADNTLPITSAAVAAQIGNIEVLLQKI